MRFSSEVRIALIGAFILLVPSQAVLALSGPEVNVIAKGITVRIDGKNTGSGVIINRQGNTYVVLTNWHVVNAAGTYIVQTSDGRRYSVNSSLVKRQPAVDLAVLQFTSSQSYRVAELGNSDSLTEGIKVYVAGWADPGPLIPERSYQFLTGYISSRLQRPKDGYSLVYTINAVPGMSGGPVLDDRGYVVGINGRAIPDLRTGTVSFVLGIGINTYLRAGNNVEMVRGSLPPAVRSLSAVNFFSRGVDKAERGDYQGAIADYNQALQLNPNFAEAYNNRGLARYKQGGIAGAIADYNQALQLNPNFAEAYNNRGLARYKQGGIAGAIADYNQALQLNPNFAEAYNNRGLARYKQGGIAGAIADYNQAIQLNANFAQAYANRGIARRQIGDRQSAIADFQKSENLFLQQRNTDDYQRVLSLIRELQP